MKTYFCIGRDLAILGLLFWIALSASKIAGKDHYHVFADIDEPVAVYTQSPLTVIPRLEKPFPVTVENKVDINSIREPVRVVNDYSVVDGRVITFSLETKAEVRNPMGILPLKVESVK